MAVQWSPPTTTLTLPLQTPGLLHCVRNDGLAPSSTVEHRRAPPSTVEHRHCEERSDAAIQFHHLTTCSRRTDKAKRQTSGLPRRLRLLAMTCGLSGAQASCPSRFPLQVQAAPSLPGHVEHHQMFPLRALHGR